MFSLKRSTSFTGSERSRSSTPIQRIWRYLSHSDLPGAKYRSELSLPPTQVVDDGHPLGLGNPKILSQIFHHLEASDLVQLRLVSLRWNHIACQHLRRKLAPCQLRPSRLKEFLRMMRRCFCNPFGSYAIRVENLKDLQTRNFFKRFSSDVIMLRVKICSDEIPEFFNRLVPNLPNLEVLHLIRIPEGCYSLRTDYIAPSAWGHGVFHFPKLKAILFRSDDPSIPFHRNYDAILSQVVRSSPNLVKIEFDEWNSHFSRVMLRCGITNPKSFDGWNFTTNPKLKEDLLELFYDWKMKFKALKFRIEEALPFDLVSDLTLQTCDTLFHLALMNDEVDAKFQLSSRVGRLVTLNLQGWKGPVALEELSDQLPSLQTLKLRPSNFRELLNDENDNPDEAKSRRVTFSLKEMRIPSVSNLTVMPLDPLESEGVDKELMHLLLKMFPEVTQLSIQVCDNEGTHLIYTGWPGLTALSLDVRGSADNEALTGIPECASEVTGRWKCGCFKYQVKDEERRETCIGNLSNLKTLQLRSNFLSDITLFEGISYLDRLDTLCILPPALKVVNFEDSSSISNCEFPAEEEQKQMSKPFCLRAIADCFKRLRNYVVSNDVVYSEEDINYLHTVLPDLVIEFKD